jgi:hypothetical protein
MIKMAQGGCAIDPEDNQLELPKYRDPLISADEFWDPAVVKPAPKKRKSKGKRKGK